MATIYFPACKTTAKYPKLAADLLTYLENRFEDLQIAACCKGKDAMADITADDTVIYTCGMCAMFLKDGSAANAFSSIWEVMDADKSFTFPSHQGKKLTIQDCWRVPDEAKLHDAIRSILGKMNIEVVELEKNRADADFCGHFLYDPNIQKFTSWSTRIAEHKDQFFQPHTADEITSLMKHHASLITTDEVVCYCGSCRDGLITGLGEQSVIHLLELIFG